MRVCMPHRRRSLFLIVCLSTMLLGFGCSPDDTSALPTATATTAAATETANLMTGLVIATASMSVARASHSATLLPGGMVLIAGGCTLAGCEMGDDGATAEIYDPVKDEFTRTGRMTTERVGHTATLLPSGKVLLAGGFDRHGVLTSAELYDPTTGEFSATATMSVRRGGYSATLLPDGKVLIAGGFDGSQRLSSAELYDAETGSFSSTGEMGGRRGEHAAALLPEGRVLVTGGSSGRGEILASAEVYDPTLGTFQRVGDMTVPRHKHAAIALRDGRVLVVGGSDARDGLGQYDSAELFDQSDGAFSATGSMAAERFKLTDAVALLTTGEVLVGGGDELVEVYDPTTGVFRTVESGPGADLAFTTTTLLVDGRVLIAGGYDPGINPTASTWLYDPRLGTRIPAGASP